MGSHLDYEQGIVLLFCITFFKTLMIFSNSSFQTWVQMDHILLLMFMDLIVSYLQWSLNLLLLYFYFSQLLKRFSLFFTFDFLYFSCFLFFLYAKTNALIKNWINYSMRNSSWRKKRKLQKVHNKSQRIYSLSNKQLVMHVELLD